MPIKQGGDIVSAVSNISVWSWLAIGWVASIVLTKLGFSIAALGIVFIPIAAIALLLVRRSQKQNDSDKAFGEGFKYSHIGGQTGIAIDPARKILRLRKDAHSKYEVIKDYAFADIREFEKVCVRGGQVVGGYMGASVQGATAATLGNIGLAAQNRRIARDNQLASGIFITAKDVENPKWRVAFGPEKDMDRWMEILRQAMAD